MKEVRLLFIFQNKIKRWKKNSKFFFIDDDIALGHIYTMILQEEGYEVLYQTSLNGAKACIVETHPDMIVLDVEIGNKNGIEAVPELKAIAPNTPILFISSHTNSQLIVQALSAGAVAYLKKPFEIDELIAYIKRYAISHPYQIKIGSLLLDTDTQLLCTKELKVIKQLSEAEYKLLKLLVAYKEQLVERRQIEEELWGKANGNEQGINNLISKLRKYLSIDPTIELVTIPRNGYKLSVNLS